jgi:hypothetical protein
MSRVLIFVVTQGSGLQVGSVGLAARDIAGVRRQAVNSSAAKTSRFAVFGE